MNIEIPKKFKPVINNARQVALNTFRPISRKYDRAEHQRPKELDMVASVLDGFNEGDPTALCIGGDDDYISTLGSQYSTPVTGARNFDVVMTSFSAGTTINYTLTIDFAP